MKKDFVKYFAFGILIVFSVALFGCKHETIKFYRESKVSEVMNKIKNQDGSSGSKKGVLKKSSGVIIYKDTSSSGSSGGINFGPRDINFDMPIRMK